MKNSAILLILIICFSQSLSSQNNSNVITENRVEKYIYVGMGFGYGIFYPGDVNDYISYELSNVTITQGVTDLFTNFVGRISVTYRVTETIDLCLVGEYAWGPKYFAITNGSDVYYHFDRASPGLLAKFHIPFKSGRHSIFFAPGLFYHSMKFEEFKGNTIGARAEMGFSFNFRKFNLQPFLCYDYAKATDNKYGVPFELNYSGVQIGVDFNF